MSDPRRTPAMQQYARFKRQHPDCVLFFRMGDFYEMFDDDAITVSKALGLTLTQRTEGVPMAGVPYHQLDVYLKRMIEQGFRVAVCDQVQDPKEARGIVERAVTRVLTPGTLVDDSLLSDSASSMVAAVCEHGPDSLSIAAVDLSTGAFTLADAPTAALADLITRLGVTEILYSDHDDGRPPDAVARIREQLNVATSPRPAWQFRPAEAAEALLEQFAVATLAGFGIDDDDPALPAAGALVRFLRETQTPDAPEISGTKIIRKPTLAHLRPPQRERSEGFCTLDATSLRALEVERTIRGGAIEGSLLGLFITGRRGVCRTPMGRRLVASWLKRPLADVGAIHARQRCVATLLEDRRTASALGDALANVQDVSRIAARIALSRATPRDLVALGRSLDRLDAITGALADAPAFASHLDRLITARDALAPLARAITEACVSDPPPHAREGGIFRDGYDAELDEARSLQRDAGSWLASYQKRLTEAHGLPNLKVGFNRVFGYYIELPAAQARRAPDEFTRKQTLKNAERYITPELREFELKVTTAEARAIERERVLFDALCSRAADAVAPIGAFADAVAELDVLLCFADAAEIRRWTQPRIVDEPTLDITAGRHPVLDERLAADFVPNDVALATPDHPAPLALITGPNMAGKSTYIRQTALLVLLALTGSFIPAERATIGVCDRIFTRVGADDALHAGQSTFMVEMTETAAILNGATPRSLVVLDEIGRGTSTLDGLSLAWAIAEHLAGHRAPRTLFATHYHELTELEDRLPDRVRNLHVAVREWGDEIIFLHRIQPGRTDRSYGLHVARIAGVPLAVIHRAKEILDSLSVEHQSATRSRRGTPKAHQPTLFEAKPHPALQRLRSLDLEALSPLQAFDTLRTLKEEADGP